MKSSQTALAESTTGLESGSVEAAGENAVTIENRFGTFAFDPKLAIAFPRGLLGFPDHREFGLADLADPRLTAFKLLQSLADPSLCFLVSPCASEGGPHAAADLEPALADLSIAREDAAVLLLVTVRKAVEGIQVTVNLRAPVLVDTRAQTAQQYVLRNEDYRIQHPLDVA